MPLLVTLRNSRTGRLNSGGRLCGTRYFEVRAGSSGQLAQTNVPKRPGIRLDLGLVGSSLGGAKGTRRKVLARSRGTTAVLFRQMAAFRADVEPPTGGAPTRSP